MTGPSSVDPTSFLDDAPCGLVVTRLDGTVVWVNTTLSRWLGRSRSEIEGRARFAELLTVGGRIYHETHIAPLLIANGRANGIALDLRGAERRIPVLVTAVVTADRSAVRYVVFDAGQRRAYEDELLRARRDADDERSRIQALATTLQRTLLPPTLPTIAGLDSAALYHSASSYQVGGDFYDLFPAGPKRWGFFLGDVCGKGPEAAVVTSLARYTLRSCAADDDDPVSALANLHAVLGQEERHGLDGRYCTVINGTITNGHHGSFELELATGGHPPPVVFRAEGGAAFLDMPVGQPVGLVPDPEFSRTRLVLRPGDVVLLFTDGLTEARDVRSSPATRRRLDEDGLLDVLTASAARTATDVIGAVEALISELGTGMEDDVAALALGVCQHDESPHQTGPSARSPRS